MWPIHRHFLLRIVGANAIKLGSWDKHPAYCILKSVALSLAFVMRFTATRRQPIAFVDFGFRFCHWLNINLSKHRDDKSQLQFMNRRCQYMSTQNTTKESKVQLWHSPQTRVHKVKPKFKYLAEAPYDMKSFLISDTISNKMEG